jgi:hypothetical protein
VTAPSCCTPAQHVCFVYPDKTRTILEGPWHVHAFKPNETQIVDEDTGTRYIVESVDEELQTVWLAPKVKAARAPRSPAGPVAR